MEKTITKNSYENENQSVDFFSNSLILDLSYILLEKFVDIDDYSDCSCCSHCGRGVRVVVSRNVVEYVINGKVE